MSHLEEYLQLAREHPDLFRNPPGPVFTILLDECTIGQVEDEMQQQLKRWGVSSEDAERWSRVGIAHRDQYLFILRDAVRFPDGSTGTYVRMVDPGEGAPGVIILPVYQGQVLLIRHFRHATRAWHLEIPRGFGEDGLSSEESARRELAEEIGATASRLLSLGQLYPDTGISAARNEMFFADVDAYGRPDEREAIADLIAMDMDEFGRRIRENDITDGYTLAAYGRATALGLI